MMTIVLRQEFPLGRFHATPWRVNPYGDPYGEWPPSPWRLVRALTARWYQWARETAKEPDLTKLEQLQAALCNCSYAFHLPASAWKGRSLRQYHPTEFGWRPAEKKKGGMRSYGTSLVQDNYWCVSPEAPVWWFIEGDDWTDELRALLTQCLERMIYFGRAETLTRVRVVGLTADIPRPNCRLVDKRTAGAVPVLSPLRDATRDDIERTTDNPEAVKRTPPPGSQWLYAVRPFRPVSRERARVPVHRSECHLMQFAIGWNVAPDPRAIVRLTSRFRGNIVRELLRVRSNDLSATWTNVAPWVRESVANMAGENANGEPLNGYHHAEFFAWCEGGRLTRLLVWRGARPFDPDEQESILLAASQGASWAAAGSGAGEWRVRLIPLARCVSAPSGFGGQKSVIWESVTPYVLPRRQHRGGRQREGESMREQLVRELQRRGISETVEVELLREPTWVLVHSRHRMGSKAPYRLGYWIRLRFTAPVAGPLRLGHSSGYGLGLLRPANVEDGVSAV